MREITVTEIQQALDQSDVDEILCVVDGDNRCVIMPLKTFENMEILMKFLAAVQAIPANLRLIGENVDLVSILNCLNTDEFKGSKMPDALRAFVETLGDENDR